MGLQSNRWTLVELPTATATARRIKVNSEPEVTVEVKQENKPDAKPAGKKAGESVGQVLGSIVDTLEVALTKRANTVMVRVNDDALAKLDMLIDAGICKSRSESAAFLLQRGIESSARMFDRIGDVTDKISRMREELLDWVQTEAK
jgi:hypothetical protein